MGQIRQASQATPKTNIILPVSGSTIVVIPAPAGSIIALGRTIIENDTVLQLVRSMSASGGAPSSDGEMSVDEKIRIAKFALSAAPDAVMELVLDACETSDDERDDERKGLLKLAPHDLVSLVAGIAAVSFPLGIASFLSSLTTAMVPGGISSTVEDETDPSSERESGTSKTTTPTPRSTPLAESSDEQPVAPSVEDEDVLEWQPTRLS